jgi:hypothetical protein
MLFTYVRYIYSPFSRGGGSGERGAVTVMGVPWLCGRVGHDSGTCGYVYESALALW